jgi:hypothetical protein
VEPPTDEHTDPNNPTDEHTDPTDWHTDGQRVNDTCGGEVRLVDADTLLF